MRTVYVNGEYVPENEAKISVFDRGFLMADAIYEVAAVLLNGLLSQPLPGEDEWSEHAAELLNDACAAVQEAAQLTARAMRRRKVEQTSLQRLLNRINAPVAGLPLILKAQLGPSEVHSLSLAIEKGLA